MKMVSLRKCVFLIYLFYHVSCEELKLIQRLPKNSLLKYTSYSSVMILHFKIPIETIKAVFVFKAKDTPTSVLVRNCDARNVSIFMKPGAYPVINPDGVPFPTTFLNESRPQSYEIKLATNLKNYYKNISAPAPGDWFAAAFISWTDPKNDRIEQQGLSSECEANLYAELYIEQRPNIPILPTLTVVKATLRQTKPILYKFYIPENTDHVLIVLKLTKECTSCGKISASVQESRFPTPTDHLTSLNFSSKPEKPDNLMLFWPKENRWHYLDLRFTKESNVIEGDKTEISIYLKYMRQKSLKIGNDTERFDRYFKAATQRKLVIPYKPLQNIMPYKQYDMMRISSAENFMFEYDFQPIGNGSSPMVVNVTNKEMSVLKFVIYDVIDIGGTLSLGFAIKPNLGMKKTESPNVTVIACAERYIKEIPTFPDQCVNNQMIYNASVILNTTIAGSLHLVHIPFPEPGTWYVTLRAFYEDCLPCKCSDKCQDKFLVCLKDCEYRNIDDGDGCIEECRNRTVMLEDCKNCDCDGSCERKHDEKEKNISLIISVSSHPCVAGRCGKHGRCNHYIAGGFIYSACQCFGGFRGWDCSDGSRARSEAEILSSILLLTLSNLLFILSVYFAYRRKYYTEAVVYFFTMFFSTFYHACDSEDDAYTFCLFRLGVLQFCDFYCGLMSIWVTLIAMAHFNNRYVSISHICGAILLAFGTIFNKQALWVFLMPAISGLVLIGISWGLRCRKTRKLFPAKKYLVRFMPIGTFLVLMGLISFAFLQTKDNYWFVHSIWHAIMAVSVIFLLPSENNFIPKS